MITKAMKRGLEFCNRWSGEPFKGNELCEGHVYRYLRTNMQKAKENYNKAHNREENDRTER